MEEPIGIPTFYQRHIHIPLPHLALQKTAPALLVCRDLFGRRRKAQAEVSALFSSRTSILLFVFRIPECPCLFSSEF